jgi:hypothetical protein
MRKLIPLLLLACCLDAFSQIEKPITKGNVMLVGGVSIQSNNVPPALEPNTIAGAFTISLSPGFDYFIKDNLAIGLNSNISYYHVGTSANYSLGIGPTIRYYFKNGLFVKAETMISYMRDLSTVFGSNRPLKQTNYSLVPGIGYAFFLNQKVALEPCLSYMIQHTIDQNLNTHNFLLELKFSIFL